MKKESLSNSGQNNIYKSYYLIIALIICTLTGLICGYLYQNSPKNAIVISKFQKVLAVKEKLASKTLDDLNQIIIHSSVDSLIHYPFAKNSISYYVFENNELVFWSDNQRDISNVVLTGSTNWKFVQLPNAYSISRFITIGSRKVLALITIKNNYPYENDELTNSFAKGFNLDNRIQITKGKDSDKLAVFGAPGNYLFSLLGPKIPVFNETFANIGLVA